MFVLPSVPSQCRKFVRCLGNDEMSSSGKLVIITFLFLQVRELAQLLVQRREIATCPVLLTRLAAVKVSRIDTLLLFLRFLCCLQVQYRRYSVEADQNQLRRHARASKPGTKRRMTKYLQPTLFDYFSTLPSGTKDCVDNQRHFSALPVRFHKKGRCLEPTRSYHTKVMARRQSYRSVGALAMYSDEPAKDEGSLQEGLRSVNNALVKEN